MGMTGIRISNNIGTVTNEYPSEGLQVTIIRDGQETIAYVDGMLDAPVTASMMAKVPDPIIRNADSPIGPRDLFTRPWRPGDRQPTEMEQMSKPDWFRDLPNTNIETRTVANFGASRTVAANMGGETPLIYPSGSQSLTLVKGVAQGITAYSFVIPEGDHPGVGRISLAQAESGDCAGTFAISTEKGATEGGTVLAQYKGNMPVFNFQVAQSKPGFGAFLPRGVVLYVNARYEGSPGSNQLVQIEAHDRV